MPPAQPEPNGKLDWPCRNESQCAADLDCIARRCAKPNRGSGTAGSECTKVRRAAPISPSLTCAECRLLQGLQVLRRSVGLRLSGLMRAGSCVEKQAAKRSIAGFGEHAWCDEETVFCAPGLACRLAGPQATWTTCER